MNLRQVSLPPLLAVCAFGETGSAQQKREIKSIGCYDNLRTDGQHTSGYTVLLWSWNNQIIGTIEYHRDLTGRPPIGLLSDIQFEPGTGKISFQAKLTTGLHSCEKHHNVPSNDLLSFRGFLKSDRLVGDIVVLNQLDSPPGLIDRRDGFILRAEDDCPLRSFEAYEIWWWYLEPAYRSRGPQW